MSERPEQSDRPSDQAARVERFLAFNGVDRWFREELAVGLGAAYEANILYRAQGGAEITNEEYSEAFMEGAEWTINRARSRYGNELERTIWKMFGSEEQVQYMYSHFCVGRFHYSGADSRETMGVFLVGDLDSFECEKPQRPARQAA